MMKYLKNPILILIFSTTFLLSCNNTSHEATNEVDEEFNSKIKAAGAERREYDTLREQGKANKEADPQIKYAPDFFSYYLEHPHTKTGKRALFTAFMFWGNLGDYNQAKKAISQIDVKSDVWSHIIPFIGNAYGNEKKKEFLQLLLDLENKLTDETSKAAVFMRLGEHYLKTENHPSIANAYFEKILPMNVDSFYTGYAKGYLYEIESLNIGQPAPDFTVNDINGNKIKLSDLRGNVVLLDFWATWCTPCIPEIPHLQRIYSNHKEDNFFLIGISLDRELEKLREFIEKENMQWPQICDGKKRKGIVTKLYNINPIPNTYIIDMNGRIAFKNLRGDELEAAVKELLNP